MAKGKKTGGRNFTGQPGPGRPKMSPELKAVKELTKTAFEECVHRFVYMNKDELSAHLKEPSTPVLELMIGTIVKEAIIRGDQNRLNFVLDRMIGKVKDTIEHAGVNGEPLKLVIEDYRAKE